MWASWTTDNWPINWSVTLNSIYNNHTNPSDKGTYSLLTKKQITTKASNDITYNVIVLNIVKVNAKQTTFARFLLILTKFYVDLHKEKHLKFNMDLVRPCREYGTDRFYRRQVEAPVKVWHFKTFVINTTLPDICTVIHHTHAIRWKFTGSAADIINICI